MKQFCEWSPFTYRISVLKCRCIRHLQNFFCLKNLARERREALPVVVYAYQSPLRRKLGSVDARLQDNKAVNLGLAAPKVTGIVIKPGETFSFWSLLGKCTAKKGYQEGLMIAKGKPVSGVGGGVCQFSNLIHWLVLHTPLTVVEHHHHEALDLFPDDRRQTPFGTGTSIQYNYLDYRFKNDTEQEFQLLVHTTEEYLCGEIRTTKELPFLWEIKVEDECFVKQENQVFRTGKVYRSTIEKATGETVKKELLKENHAKVMYDTSGLKVVSADYCQ